MGKKKKKEKDFAKVKLKVGKTLKKATATDTRVTAKKVVLVEQLSKAEGTELSHRGLSLDELCRQLGHFNVNVRKDAIVGIRQILLMKREAVSDHLYMLIPTVGRLIADESSDAAFQNQLRALLEVLCKVPSLSMSPHFPLFMAHAIRGLTHLKLNVRSFAISALTLIMRSFPDLCKDSIDLFDEFLVLLSGNRKPPNKQLLIDALLAFLNVFAIVEVKKDEGPLFVCILSFKNRTATPINIAPIPCFDFELDGPTQGPPLDSTEGVLRLCEAVCPFLETLILDEKSSFVAPSAAIAQKLVQIVSRMRAKNEEIEFTAKLNVQIGRLMKLSEKDHIPAPIRKSLLNLTKSESPMERPTARAITQELQKVKKKIKKKKKKKKTEPRSSFMQVIASRM